jgi:AraC-like DNA-binding protein
VGTMFEGRFSDSPYIDSVWRGQIGKDYYAVCPADIHWNMLFQRYDGQVRVTVEGPTTQYISKTQTEGIEFLVITFRLGTFISSLRINNLLNTDMALPAAVRKAFWLDGFTWQLPDFDNVETFVERLVREDVLVYEPLVHEALQDQPLGWSPRTVRRRFLQATGLTPKAIEQIERARQARLLLEQGVPISDAAAQLGYADQPHLTRSLRRFVGQTPAQIARENTDETPADILVQF